MLRVMVVALAMGACNARWARRWSERMDVVRRGSRVSPTLELQLDALGYLKDAQIDEAVAYAQEAGEPCALTDMDDEDFEAMIEEMALFLCVWSEASSLRFCPELLYFVFELARSHYVAHKPQHRRKMADRSSG